MTNVTMTRKDIIRELRRTFNQINDQEANAIIKSIRRQLLIGLVTDGIVKVTGFGTFQVYFKKQRLGRNPKTGKPAVIRPRNMIKLRRSEELRQL